MTFLYSSPRIKDYQNFILEAIKIDGYAFKFASINLKNNHKFILEALKEKA